MEEEYVLRVYLDDGRIFKYSVNGQDKVREHASAIIKTGYRHNNGAIFEHYPPHRISKVQCVGQIDTTYEDEVTGT